MYAYLQTQQGQIAAGLVIVAIIFTAFVLIAIKNHLRKKVFVMPSRKECSLLTAQNWFTIISDNIEYSSNLSELQATMEKIEAFRTKEFRFRITKAERGNYIDNLYTLYCQKEIELQTPIRVELCPQ